MSSQWPTLVPALVPASSAALVPARVTSQLAVLQVGTLNHAVLQVGMSSQDSVGFASMEALDALGSVSGLDGGGGGYYASMGLNALEECSIGTAGGEQSTIAPTATPLLLINYPSSRTD
jgi:hypothetical protein